MADVKRYDLFQDGKYDEREGVMSEVSNGDWVRSDEYFELHDAYEVLAEKLAKATDVLKETVRDLEA